jgi:hypothetical protein
MITLQASLGIMIGLFAGIGWTRGWAREVVAAAGLILTLFAIDQVGYSVLRLIGAAPEAGVIYSTEQMQSIQRLQILFLSGFVLIMAIFSYQGPKLASGVAARLRLRENVGERILGLIAGGVNGYFIVGSIQSFNEYIMESTGWVRLPFGQQYVLAPTVIRPVYQTIEQWENSYLTYMPPQLLAPYLLPMLIVVFLFVIVVLI